MRSERQGEVGGGWGGGGSDGGSEAVILSERAKEKDRERKKLEREQEEWMTPARSPRESTCCSMSVAPLCHQPASSALFNMALNATGSGTLVHCNRSAKVLACMFICLLGFCFLVPGSRISSKRGKSRICVQKVAFKGHILYLCVCVFVSVQMCRWVSVFMYRTVWGMGDSYFCIFFFFFLFFFLLFVCFNCSLFVPTRTKLLIREKKPTPKVEHKNEQNLENHPFTQWVSTDAPYSTNTSSTAAVWQHRAQSVK
jgi:hypothetical protein